MQLIGKGDPVKQMIDVNFNMPFVILLNDSDAVWPLVGAQQG